MYLIYQNGVNIAQTKDKNYTISGLKPNTTYAFGVSQKEGNKESKIVRVEVTTNEEPQPVEPVVEVETVSKKYEDLTVAEIKEVLDGKGIEYSVGDRKKELYEKMVNNV